MVVKPTQRNHSLTATCKAEKRKWVRKLKILKQVLEYKMGKQTDIKDFIFANPLLPCETIIEANAQTTHLAMQLHKPSHQLSKELFFPTSIDIYSL